MMPGHLPESRGEPDDKQQTDAGPGESGAHAGGRPIDDGDSCGSFGQHHWADGKGCTDLVGLLVAGEAGTADQCEQRIMHDLHEPD